MHQALLDISVIVAASALLAWLAVVLRQPIIMAYVAGGMLAGPWGFKLVSGTEFIDAVSQFGIILLLFHAGVVLPPRRLGQLFRQTLVVTLGQFLLTWTGATLLSLALGFGLKSSALVGLSMIFGSTILLLKLIPTNTLHHQRMGAFAVAVLLADDILAVSILSLLSGVGHPALLLAKGLMLAAAAFVTEHLVLRRMMVRAEHYHEVLFLMALGWGVGMAMAAHFIGFSPVVAAFIAGVALARGPLAVFLAEGLKMFRDFFLVFFFFVLGAQFNFGQAGAIILPSLALALAVMSFKVLGFSTLFRLVGEAKKFSWEAGIRMSQGSEFALVIAAALHGLGHIDLRAWQVIQITIIITMVISSYLVVFLLPTPLGVTRGMKQD